MEEGNVCTFCKRSFLNGNLLDVHMTEHLGLRLGIEKHNNIEHDQVGINGGNGVELDKKVIKKEVKMEVDEEKVIKKEIKLEVDKKVIKKEIKLEIDEDYGVKSYGPNENPMKSQAWVSGSHPTTKQEVISDLICKQCGKEFHSSSDLASHMKTHLLKRKRSIGTNGDDEVKKGALSLVMLSENRTDFYLDEDKLVIPNVYVDGVKKEGTGESEPGQSSTGIVSNNLRSNVQEVKDKGARKANDNQSGTVLREPKTYKCQTCFKEFSSFQGLGGHMKIHKQTP